MGRKIRQGVSWIIVVMSVIAFSGCAKKAAAPAPPAVEVTEVLQQDVPIRHEWVGTTDGMVNAVIRAQVTGYLIKQNYREGNVVKKGDVLFEIDPRPFQAALDQAAGALAQQQAQYENAKRTLARVEPLVTQNAISPKDLDDAIAAERAGRAAVAAAAAAVEKARLDLGFTKITSPVDGIAGLALAQEGDLVGPAAPASVLTTVSAIDPIKVAFPMEEETYISLVKQFPAGDPIQEAATNWELSLILADGYPYTQKGKFYAIDRQVDVGTGTMRVEGVFPNPQYLLRPGQFVRVEVVLGTRKGALLIPARSVTDLQGSAQVAVVNDDNKVEIRQVKTGARMDSLVVIEEGLHPGERVVVEGIQKAQDGQLVAPQPYVPESSAGQDVTGR